MKKRDSKLLNAAHIKRHTEGTSNELSFSVLDAAKNRVDVDEGKDNKVQLPPFGRVSVFSLPFKKKISATPVKENALPLSENAATPVPTSTVHIDPVAKKHASTTMTGLSIAGKVYSGTQSNNSSDDEILKRKRRRRRHRTFITLIVIIAAAVLVGGGSYLVITELGNHQEQVGILDQSLTKISEADKTLVSLDQEVAKSIHETDSKTLQLILEDIPTAESQLSDAKRLSQNAANKMRDSAEKEASIQAQGSIDARFDMLEIGGSIISLNIQAQEDLEILTKAWTHMESADTIAREAASLVTDTTRANVEASKEKSEEAKYQFNEALWLVESLSTSPLKLDVSAIENYLSKKIEAMDYALASDDAILSEDRRIAEEQNEAYNTADAEAMNLAKLLPSDAAELIEQAYENRTQEPLESYRQSRLKASTADAFLRDYLGT